MSPPKLSLEFEDTLEGVREAEATLRRLRDGHESGSTQRPSELHQPAGANAAVTLYDHTQPASRSRTFLTLLREDGQTLAELAERMPHPDGSALSTASMRAVHRNVRRTEGRLQREGRLSRQVVQVSYATYAAENAARYSLLPEDASALSAHLS